MVLECNYYQRFGNIEAKENNLAFLKAKREDAVKEYDEILKSRNEKITKQEARIAAIS